MSQLVNDIEQGTGFRISGSHFRIGSKLHLTDFYYAKLCFQDSFYSSRFAFLLARQIARDLKNREWMGEEEDQLVRKGISIIGYGIYTEFMLSLVSKFLVKALGNRGTVNYNIVADAAELSLLKPPRLLPSVIIIVPVACTFSTSIKVEQFLTEKIRPSVGSKGFRVLPVHYNLLRVNDQARPAAETRPSVFEKTFGWEEKFPDQKLVRVKAFFNDAPRWMRYFLNLPSTWNEVQECEHCFPDENSPGFPLAELPLLDTDRTSLLPRIIFDYPREMAGAKKLADNSFKLLPSMIDYQPGRGTGHFVYQVDLTRFLEENRNQVQEWLRKIRDSIEFRNTINGYSNVIILAPAQSHNTGFLLMVNEELFASAANIIHYDPANDYMQNFENLYGEELAQAEKIIFVNDSISGGRHFFKLDELYRQACRHKGHGGGGERVIDMALILLDQSPPVVFNSMQERVSKEPGIFTYTRLNLYSSLSTDDPPLGERFKDLHESLARDSLLDGTCRYFREQKTKFSTPLPASREEDQQRHWWMVKATHCLYELLGTTDVRELNGVSFKDFFALYQSRDWKINSFRLTTNPDPDGFCEDQAALLKVLSQAPFSQYAPLLKLSFRWTIGLLRAHSKRMLKKLSEKGNGDLAYKDLVWLKFLLRRAANLGINYIFSLEFLNFLNAFYQRGVGEITKSIEQYAQKLRELTQGEDRLRHLEENTQSKLRELRHFHVFYAAQVKILIFENELRSIRLERNIRELNSSGFHPGFRQQIRILQEENTTVIRRYCEMLSNRPSWTDKPADAGEPLLLQMLKSPEISNHQHSIALRSFFQTTQGERESADPASNPPFLAYLALLRFLQNDQTNEQPILEKTDYIAKQLRALMELRSATGVLTENTGVFFLIRDFSGKLTILLETPSVRPVLEEGFWTTEKESYFQQFLDGKTDKGLTYNKRIVELSRDPDTDEWVDLFAPGRENKITGISNRFRLQELNHLLLVRLSLPGNEQEEEEALGIMGIYANRDVQGISEINRLRYLLLLREPLVQFIEKHHRSNEFMELQQARRAKSLILLAGHGREMITRIGENYPDLNSKVYPKIAANLAQLQGIMTLLQFGSPELARKAMLNSFYDIYHLDTEKKIDAGFFGVLQMMISDIFRFEEVETEVQVQVTDGEPDEGLNFIFSRKILLIICFELLVNAKKNRWHFLSGAPAPAGFICNRVSFSLREENGLLLLCIRNTGPWQPERVTEELKKSWMDSRQVDISSGTNLMKHLVLGILKDDIQFIPNEPFEEPGYGVYWFTVRLRLRPMQNNENEKDFINRKSIGSVQSLS